MSWTILGASSWYAADHTDGLPITGTKSWPAGANTAGDLGILVLHVRGNTGPAVHADWTLIGSSVSTDVSNSGLTSVYLYVHVRGASNPDMTWVTPTIHVGNIAAYRHSTETTFTIGTPTFQQSTNGALTTHTLTGGVAATVDDSLVIFAASNGRGVSQFSAAATTPSTASGAIDTTTAPSLTAWYERADNGIQSTYAVRGSLHDAVKDTGSTGSISIGIGAGSKVTLGAVAIRPGVDLGGVIDIDNHVEKIVYEGAAGSATVTFSGEYTGADDTIQIRIEDYVSGVAALDWTTLEASPTGGAYSASISVPRGGWYKAKVRKLTYPATSAETTLKWGVGVVLGLLGQSHLLEFNTEGTDTANDRAVECTSSAPIALSSTGQGRNALADALIAAMDCPVMYIQSSTSGTLLSYWYSGGPTTPYNTWKARADAVGAALSGWVLWQGDADAQASTARATYESTFAALESEIQADFGAPLSVIVNLGRYGSGSDTPWNRIRQTHVGLSVANADRRGVMTMDVEPDGDTQHFPPASHAIIGARIAQCVAEYFGDAAYSRGPVIASATYSGADVVVNLTHDGGTDITPTSAITGIDVLDNGTPATITAAVRESSSSVRLTCSATLSGPVTVRAGYGAFPTVTGWVVDDTALSLPLVSTDAAVTATAALPTTSLTMAVQQARAIAAGMQVAVQTPGQSTTSASVAVQAARTAQAGLTAAVQQAHSAVAGLAAVVQAPGVQSTALAAAVQLAGSAVTSLDLAVQAQGSAVTSLDLAVQAQSSATTGVSLQVQAGSSVSTGVSLQVQTGSSVSVAASLAVLRQALATAGLSIAAVAPGSTSTGLSVALRAAQSATSTLALAVQAARNVSASVSLQVQDGLSLAAALDVAVQRVASATTTVQLAIAQAATANTSLAAAVMVQRSVAAAISSAIKQGKSITCGLNLYVAPPDAPPDSPIVTVTDVTVIDRYISIQLAGQSIVANPFIR